MKLSLALAAATLCSLPASAGPAAVAGIAAGAAPTSYAQYRRFGRRHGYHARGWRRGYGYGRGPGVGAGVAGAIIGGAIAGSQVQAAPVVVQGGPEAVAACARRFRSYDPASGTYLGHDGVRHPCP
ncbi:BA14K family protein [Methylobacterium sp. WSM2598]|uniref:BA14K family protein n=1 Tax=Methylobacterium sp. WSM2598 TaxID=398261 RepID=UPI000362A5D1|nr:BA14K family protein [Methylobacterium sp. WSM2598]